MMPDIHKKVLLAVIGGMILGWFLSAFVFYPPQCGWWAHSPSSQVEAKTSIAAPNNEGFWIKTMDPGNFWIALSALATTGAVIVALIVPFRLDASQNKRRRAVARAALPSMLAEVEANISRASEAAKYAKHILDRVREALEERRNNTSSLYGDGPLPGADEHERAKLENFSKYSFPTYAALRSHLADISPDVAVDIYAKISESELLSGQLQQDMREWLNYAAEPELKSYLERIEKIANFLSLAAAVMREELGWTAQQALT
jgi:hypothetical protein